MVHEELENLEVRPEIKQCCECTYDLVKETKNLSSEDAVAASSSRTQWRQDTLAKDEIVALHNELRLQLTVPLFARRMRALLAKGPTQKVEEKRSELLREVEQKAISLHNFEATDKGVKVIREVCQAWRSDPDVNLLHRAIMKELCIDAFGDNPDIELAKLKALTSPAVGGNKAMVMLEATNGVFEGADGAFAATKFATTRDLTQIAAPTEEAAEKAVEKAATHKGDPQKQCNSPRAAAVALCCRG